MTGRHFFTEAELRVIAARQARHPAPPPGLADQLDAVEREASEAFARELPHFLIQQGNGWGVVTNAATAPETVAVNSLQATKMLMTAYTAGPRELCPHTRQVRPQVMFCDPPVRVCKECLPSVLPEISRMTPRWDNECDCCGAHDAKMFPVTVVALGTYLNGNVCEACHVQQTSVAFRETPEVRVIGRKQPCPCGSGRKYKRCCGSDA